MLTGLGRFTYRYRRRIIVGWAVLVLVGALFAPRVSSQLTSAIESADTEAKTGLELLEAKLGFPSSGVVLLYSSDVWTADDPRFQAEVQRSIEDIRSMDELARIDSTYSSGRSEMVSADRHATYVVAWFDLSLNDAVEHMDAVRANLANPPNLRLDITGAPAIFRELEEASERDLVRAEIITLPLVLIALVIIFGGLVAAGLPVIMGGVSLVLTLAVLFFLAQAVDMSIFALNIASLIGLGVAVDYSLFMVSRFREEIYHRGPEESVAITVATAGRAVIFSGLTTIIGLSGLMVFEFAFLRSLGIGGVAVVALSLLVALTLVPALLGVLGERINALPVFPRRAGRSGFWAWTSHTVMRRPLLFLIPAGAALLSLGVPFLGVNLGPVWAGSLPEEAPARVGWELMAERFGEAEISPVVVMVQAQGDMLARGNVGALYDYTRRLEEVPGVTGVGSIVNIGQGISKEQYQRAYETPGVLEPLTDRLADQVRDDTTVVRVFGDFSVASGEGKALVGRVRAVDPGPEFRRYVTGATASLRDSIDALYRDFPKAIAIVVVSIYVALMLVFRSVVLPLKAVLLNGISIFASFGALVFIFQQGHLEGLLNFRADGAVEASVPILLFCILFGLSMDYELFLLSRIKEEHDRTGDNERSIAWGMQRSGNIITSAAMVVVLVGVAFSFGDVMIVKALGIGLALAVFIDATVVRALMAPSLMRILGKWNWWAPRWLLRVLPNWEYVAPADVANDLEHKI